LDNNLFLSSSKLKEQGIWNVRERLVPRLRTQGGRERERERERERLIASADKVPSFKIQHQPIKPFGTIS
jgi:hypothetical protein